MNNGWIAQVNWNDYRHCTRVARVEAFDEDHNYHPPPFRRMFASRDFTVGTISDEFIRDHDGTSIRVADFPVMGQISRFVWSTATQHWEAMDSFPCGEGDGCEDQTTNNGNNGNDAGDSAWDPHRIIPEITIEERVTAGTQPLPQYQSLMDWPQDRSGGCCISVSMIFEPGDWMFLKNSSKGTVLIPHDEIEAKRGEISRLALKGVWPPLGPDTLVVNLIGVGIERLYMMVRGNSYEATYYETMSNDPKLFPYIPPDMTLPMYAHIHTELQRDLGVSIPKLFYFLNSETGEFGYRAGVDNFGGKSIPGEWYRPNNGRGPWRHLGTSNLAVGNAIIDSGRRILYFPPTQTVFRRSFDQPILAEGPNRRFARDDIRGTGKLEIIAMTNYLYDYWVDPPDPSETIFTASPVVYRSAATE